MTAPAARPGSWSSVLLRPGVHHYAALCEMVAAFAGPDSVVLDVGAGDGDREYPTWLSGSVGRIVGVDPSAGVLANDRVDERVQSTLEDFAPAHRQSFDLAVVCYVVEHIARPRPFLEALHQCLRPGGSAFVLTPHALHYFGATAWLARRLHVDEWLLHRLRDEATLHEHHFPVQYRMNTRGRLARCALRAGFRRLEFLMVDEPGIYQPYFPERLRSLPVLWSRMVHGLRVPGLAGTMLARLEA